MQPERSAVLPPAAGRCRAGRGRAGGGGPAAAAGAERGAGSVNAVYAEEDRPVRCGRTGSCGWRAGGRQAAVRELGAARGRPLVPLPAGCAALSAPCY